MAFEQQHLNGNSRGINGSVAAVRTGRAVEELRRGRAIQLVEEDCSLIVAAVETMELPLLRRLQSLSDSGMTLLITAERGDAVGLAQSAASPMAISFPGGVELEELRSLAGIESHVPLEQALGKVRSAKTPTNLAAGLRLAKLGRLLPALVAVPTTQPLDAGVLTIRAEDIEPDSRSSANNVHLISRARVPLVDAVDTEIVLFRQEDGFGEHLAIVIGEANTQDVVPVRLHSACLTGDVLGSLRCDCGDQLKRAVGRMASLGNGVLLYLDQEGRGIGLANKLRAYALQDSGLDTLDADQHLGFLPDERSYDVAASMLRELRIERIRLLTNNPKKIEALTEHGIQVVGRLPLVAAVNSHNQRYLKAKLDRAGHLAE